MASYAIASGKIECSLKVGSGRLGSCVIGARVPGVWPCLWQLVSWIIKLQARGGGRFYFFFFFFFFAILFFFCAHFDPISFIVASFSSPPLPLPIQDDEMPTFKCLLVGDGGVGKTTFVYGRRCLLFFGRMCGVQLFFFFAGGSCCIFPPRPAFDFIWAVGTLLLIHLSWFPPCRFLPSLPSLLTGSATSRASLRRRFAALPLVFMQGAGSCWIHRMWVVFFFYLNMKGKG